MEALSYARLGMTQALARYDRASNALLRSVSGATEIEPAAAIADQMEAKHQFRASALTALIADEMMQSLLDVQAQR